LNLPPEQLAKGTVQDIPFDWFVESGLEDKLFEALVKEIQ
jgi:hypothetical protein